MSLYFEAEKSANGNSNRRATNPIVYIKNGLVILLVIIFLVIGGMISGISEYQKNQSEYLVKKEKIENQLRIKINNLKSENDSFAQEKMPFITFSKIHNFDIKYVSNQSGNEIPVDIEAAVKNKISASDKIRDNPPVVESKTQTQQLKVQKKHLDLNEQFAQAVAATNTGDLTFEENVTMPKDNEVATPEQINDAVPLQDLPSKLINKIPSFMYNAHNYSSDSAKRSISFDGKVIKEGGSFKNLTVVEIKPNYVILRVGNQSFSQRAMEDFSH